MGESTQPPLKFTTWPKGAERELWIDFVHPMVKLHGVVERCQVAAFVSDSMSFALARLMPAAW